MSARTLTADLFVTVDGYAAGDGAAAYFGKGGPDLDAWVDAVTAQPQTLLMGRRTFEVLAGPAAAATDPVSHRMTALPKVVVSSTLTDTSVWPGTTVLRGPLRDEVTRLKAADGPPIRSIGSPTLVDGLLSLGLVDRLRLLVFPLLLGVTGRERVLTSAPDVDLDLVTSTVLDGRLVLLEYAPR